MQRALITECPEIMEYLKIVEHPQEQYPVCEEQRQLAALVRQAFADEQLCIDRDQLSKYLDLQKYFPFQLFPWQKFCFCLHNCVYTADGALRWPELLIYGGRGLGKNGYISFEDFALLTPVNGISHYDIDIFATAEDQAKTSFQDVYDVLESNKRKLTRFFAWNRERITCKQTQSTLRFRTSNAKTKDGGRPGKVDFDEFHAYENYDVVRVARTGLGKKKHPRQTIVTTDGDVRDGPLDHLLLRAREILRGDQEDNGLLPFLCRIEGKDEVEDERNWHKANPSLRYFPTLLAEMRREYADYKMDAIGNSAFLTKRCNWPLGNLQSQITEWENIVACSRTPKGEPEIWVAGIDYAKTTDFVSVCLMGLADGEWVWRQHTWVCRACNDLSRIKFPLEDAISRGLAEWVNDVEIAPELPAQWIKEEMRAGRDIVAVAIDDYRFTLLRRALEEVGFAAGKDGNVHLVGGKEMAITAPLVISALNTQNIAFGDDAMMRWYINNTKQVLSKRGNINFEKIEPKTRKNDGFMAAVAAASLLELLEECQPIQEDDFTVWTF